MQCDKEAMTPHEALELLHSVAGDDGEYDPAYDEARDVLLACLAQFDTRSKDRDSAILALQKKLTERDAETGRYRKVLEHFAAREEGVRCQMRTFIAFTVHCFLTRPSQQVTSSGHNP